MEGIRAASAMTMVRSMGLGVQSAGRQRLLFQQRAVAVGEGVEELARLRDGNRRLRSENRLLKTRFGDALCRNRHCEGMHARDKDAGPRRMVLCGEEPNPRRVLSRNQQYAPRG